MGRYIDEAEIFDKAMETADYFKIKGFLCGIPSADVEPVQHGQWKYYHKQGIAVCTNCSFERKLNHDLGKAVSCPNCGAKMDGV